MQVRSHPETLTTETQIRVLELLRRHDYVGARVLVRALPTVGRSGFLRGATEILSLWDSFRYDEAGDALNQGRLGNQAAAFVDDSLLGILARCLRSLYGELPKLRRALAPLRQLAAGQGKIPLDSQTVDGALLIIADCLENAQRRQSEGRHTDAVLRCYRAVEAAVQLAQVQLGRNPWEMKEGLDAGVQYLRQAGAPFSDAVLTRLKELQQKRNYSYLEHGYNWVSQDEAAWSLTAAQELASAALGAAGLEPELRVLRTALTHRM